MTLKILSLGRCPEPPGQEMIELWEGRRFRAHDIMLTMDGACPWCGEEAEQR